MATTTLSFALQDNGKYLATANVTKDFAVNIKPARQADITISQKSIEEAPEPDTTESFPGRTKLDAQFLAPVPATIYIECSEPVIFGAVKE